MLQSQQTRSVRQKVIGAPRVSRPSLVQELQVARINRHGLIRIAANQVTVANVVGPSSAAVRLASEGLALTCSLRSPRAAQAVGGEGSEIASICSDGLDDHEILVGARDGVDLNGLKQVVGRIAHDHRRGRAKVAGEVSNRHARPVDFAIVSCEEQVHVGAVANDRLVDSARSGDGAGEERLRRRPSTHAGGIACGHVGEGSWSPLIRKHPNVLGRKEEQGRRNSAGAHLVLAC